MKSKRVLGLLIVLTFTVVSIFGCFNVSAETTHVTVSSYLPPVDTIVLDDDFEGSSVVNYEGTDYVNTDYTYGCENNYLKIETASNTSQFANLINDEEKGNKYLEFGKSWYWKSKKKGSVDADKLVVALDVMPKPTGNNKCFKVSFGGASKDAVFFVFNKVDETKCKFLLSFKSWYQGGYTDLQEVSSTEFSKIELVFKRVNVDGVDKAKLSEAYLNGTKLTLNDTVVNANYAKAGWWEVANDSYTIFGGNFNDSVKSFNIDNVLVYGAKTRIKNIDAVNKTVDIQNVDDAALTGKLIIAGYDSSNNLVSVKSDVSVNVPANTTTSDISFTLPTGEGISKYKFFVWDGFDNCTPCVDAVEK